MKFNWIRRAAELERAGTPFAIATVIDTIAPTSAKPMAKAIITSDGKITSITVPKLSPFEVASKVSPPCASLRRFSFR